MSNDLVIVRLDAAKNALVEARTIQDKKKLIDVGEALEILAKRQNASEEVQAEAHAFHVEAIRLLGEALAREPKNAGAAGGGIKDGPRGTLLEPRDTTPTLADMGISKKLSAQAQKVAALPPEEYRNLVNSSESVASVLKEVEAAKKKEEHAASIAKQREDIAAGEVDGPIGLFEVIVIDPPWNYGREYDPDTSRVANPYPEMDQKQLMEIEIPASDDAVMFLWTTHQFLWDAKDLLDHWGFTYKATMVWNKQKIGMGRWLRMQCEFCLIGIRGKPTWENTTWRDIIEDPRREHSRKPESFYEMVDAVTVGRKLEFFSRTKRKGWEVVGNDTEKF